MTIVRMAGLTDGATAAEHSTSELSKSTGASLADSQTLMQVVGLIIDQPVLFSVIDKAFKAQVRDRPELAPYYEIAKASAHLGEDPGTDAARSR